MICEKNSSGVECKIVCPECGITRSLSSSMYESTGTCSFTISNFSDHYRKKHGKSTNVNDQGAITQQPEQIQNHPNDHLLTECNELKNQLDKQSAMIAKYVEQIKILEDERNQNTIRSETCIDCNVFEFMLNEKDALLLEYEKKLGVDCDHCDDYKKQIHDLSASLASFKEKGNHSVSDFAKLQKI